MKDLEKQIEEAALRREKVLNGSLTRAWKDGALSHEAKEYWQQGLYTEKEVKDLIHGFHIVTDGTLRFEEKWFEQNKKK